MDREPVSKANDITFGAAAGEGLLSDKDKGKEDVPAAGDSASQGPPSHKDEVCVHVHMYNLPHVLFILLETCRTHSPFFPVCAHFFMAHGRSAF